MMGANSIVSVAIKNPYVIPSLKAADRGENIRFMQNPKEENPQRQQPCGF